VVVDEGLGPGRPVVAGEVQAASREVGGGADVVGHHRVAAGAEVEGLVELEQELQSEADLLLVVVESR